MNATEPKGHTMKKTPTLEEVVNGQIQICCSNHGCEKCPIEIYRKGIGGSRYSCDMTFLHAVVSRKLNLDGTPVHGEKPEPTKPTLPKWCKVGAWIFDHDGVLCQIDEVQEHQILVHYPNTKLELRIFDFSKLHPVRFRHYTFDKAKKLLGKVIEFTDERGHKNAQLVTHVFQNAVNGEVAINGTICRIFMKNTTIDGFPFGVPVVDEEAMKEETK